MKNQVPSLVGCDLNSSGQVKSSRIAESTASVERGQNEDEVSHLQVENGGNRIILGNSVGMEDQIEGVTGSGCGRLAWHKPEQETSACGSGTRVAVGSTENHAFVSVSDRPLPSHLDGVQQYQQGPDNIGRAESEVESSLTTDPEEADPSCPLKMRTGTQLPSTKPGGDYSETEVGRGESLQSVSSCKAIHYFDSFFRITKLENTCYREESKCDLEESPAVGVVGKSARAVKDATFERILKECFGERNCQNLSLFSEMNIKEGTKDKEQDCHDREEVNHWQGGGSPKLKPLVVRVSVAFWYVIRVLFSLGLALAAFEDSRMLHVDHGSQQRRHWQNGKASFRASISMTDESQHGKKALKFQKHRHLWLSLELPVRNLKKPLEKAHYSSWKISQQRSEQKPRTSLLSLPSLREHAEREVSQGMPCPNTDCREGPEALNDDEIVDLHPRTYSDCLKHIAMQVVSSSDQLHHMEMLEGSSSSERRIDVGRLHALARRKVNFLTNKLKTFFEDRGVDEKALQECNCSAVKDLDTFIESVTSEWGSPIGQHLRDIIAMPVGRVQLYRTAGLLKYVSMRFHTFTDFPACERASPVRLAQTGFYYTGTDDLTQCFQCDRQHHNWTVMDIPHLIHCYLSPSCPVVLRNEPLTSDQGEQDLLSSVQAESGIAQLVYLQMWRKKLTESNVTANSTMQAIRNMNRAGGGSGIVGQRLPALLPVSTRPALQTSTPLPQALPPAPIPLAVGGSRGQETGDALAREGSATGPGQFSRPHANKNYASYEQRFNSFRNWPATRTQRPDVLAHAGFFYAGAGDCVRCYHCGLGLKHWDDDDDPWLEHVRWRATCEHLIVTQGQAYVAQAFQEIVRRDREQEEIVQRFALNEEPRNVPRPRVSDNYQDISSGNRERTSQQTSPSSEPVPRPASQPAPQPTTQPAPQPTPQAAPQPAPQPAPQAAPQTVPPPAAACTTQAAPIAKEQLQGASYNAGQLDDSPPASREGEDQAAGGDDEPTEGSAEDLSASERDRIQQLRQQNLALRQQNLCRECNKQEICMLFLPCQHLTMCEVCARNVKVCKTCKKKIKKKVKTFLS